MKQVKVLGPGCRRCEALAQMVRDAAAASGVEVTVSKVTDYAEIAAHGVISTPGLVVDGRLVHAGGLPRPDEVTGWISG